MATNKKKVAVGAMWLGAGRAFVNLLGFCSTLVLARLLTPADFGLVALANTVIALVGSFTNLSLSSALIHLRETELDHLHSAWTLNMARACALGLTLAAMAWPLGAFYEDPRLVTVMLVIALTTVISGAANPQMAIMQRSLAFRQEFIMVTASKLAGFVVGISVALIWRNYWALIAGSAAWQIVGVSVSYVFAPYRPRLRLNKVSELWRFSMWLTLGQIVNTVNWRLDQLLIGTVVGKPQLGVYSVASDLAGMPTRELTMPLTQALFPGLATVASDAGRVRDAYLRVQAIIFAFAAPAGLGLAVVADPAIPLLIGPKWEGVVPIVQALGGVFALQTLVACVQPLAMAQGRTRLLFKRDLIGFAVRVPLVVIGVFAAGVPGAVAARAISGASATLVGLTFAASMLDTTVAEQVRRNLRTFAALAAMAIAVLLVRRLEAHDAGIADSVLNLIMMIATGACVYLSTLFVLWRLSRKPDGPERMALSLLRRAQRLRMGA